jgi:dUTP pyrophosphatase
MMEESKKQEPKKQELKFFKVHSDVKAPCFATEQSACFDLQFSNAGKHEYTGYMLNNKQFTRPFGGGRMYLNPHDRVMVPTGLIFDIPEGYSVRLHSRSGLSLKQGLILANNEGVIDSDYIQEVYVLLYNRSENGTFIHNGDRIAQGELVRSLNYTLTELKKQPVQKTSRIGGMGSTDV